MTPQLDRPEMGGVPAGNIGRWYDELAVDDVIVHAVRRTVTETDNVLFSAMTMNPQPLHLDAEFAAASEFGRPLVNSLFTLGLVVGLSVPELTLGTTIANLGFSDVRFPAPVFHGDTIRCATTVLAMRQSASRPEAGIVTFEHVGTNQSAQIVCVARRAAMMRRRPVAGVNADALARARSWPAHAALRPRKSSGHDREGRAQSARTRSSWISRTPSRPSERPPPGRLWRTVSLRSRGSARCAGSGQRGRHAVVADDLFAVAESSVDGVVLPKFDEPEHLELIADSGCGHLPVIVGIESVRGVADVARLAAAGVHGVYFGAEDFVADLGGVRTVEGAEVLYARSRVAIAAHVNDIAAIDQAFLQVRDNDGLLVDAQAGRRLGYSGKICVHPDQLPVVHEAFLPSERAVAHARAVVAAYATGSAAGNGVILLDGRMIDRVHLRDAEQTLCRAERMN